MKRGLISWNKEILPPSVFEARLAGLDAVMESHGLDALVTYTDVWRSNDVRFVSNYMPYWNRALTLVPRGGKPILLCALSPRVYPWIKSVTVHETVIPSPNLPAQLLKVATEHDWKRIGFCDFEGLPADLHAQLRSSSLDIVDVPRAEFRPVPTDSEIEMHAAAARLAREALDQETAAAGPMTDYQLTGLLERRLRRAGAEDLVVLVSDGSTPPIPASGQPIGPRSSVVVALEYNGHWAKVARNLARATTAFPPSPDFAVYTETLSGPYAWEAYSKEDGNSAVVSMHAELKADGARLYYGDTFLLRTGTLTIL